MYVKKRAQVKGEISYDSRTFAFTQFTILINNNKKVTTLSREKLKPFNFVKNSIFIKYTIRLVAIMLTNIKIKRFSRELKYIKKSNFYLIIKYYFRNMKG